ncbi:MAG TPA: hypothetical protein VJ768_00115 [Anaerolineales bacterium]|nr:hypothetical protein [Anaerolineales bacterium]
MDRKRINPIIYGFATAATLVGGMALGIVAASVLSEALPGHMAARNTVAAIPALAGILGSGALWGWTMDRLARTGEARRMALAGALGFSAPAILAMLSLFALEETAVNMFRLITNQPPQIHRIFTLLFVPTAAILAATGSGALGAALRNYPLARRLALSAGLAGGAGFLVVNLAMEALGWQVGGPGAAERATMITVLAVGCLGAALAAGTAVGANLSRYVAGMPEVSAGAVTAEVGKNPA